MNSSNAARGRQQAPIRRLWQAALVLILCATSACGDREPAAPQPEEPESQRPPAAIRLTDDVLSIARRFTDDSPSVRRDAALAIAGRWPDGARAAQCLLELLDDEDTRVREAAATAIAAHGVRAEATLAAYLDAVAPDGHVAESFPAERLDPEERITSPEFTAPWQPAYNVSKWLDDARRPARHATFAALAVIPEPIQAQLGSFAAAWGAWALDDPQDAEMAAAALGLSAWVVARERSLVRAVTISEAPDAWLAAIHSESPFVAFLGARLLAAHGRRGPTTNAALEAELARRVGVETDPPALLQELAFALGVAGQVSQASRSGPPAAIASHPDLVARYADGLCRFASPEEAAELVERPWAGNAAAHRLGYVGRTPTRAKEALRRVLLAQDEPDPAAAFALSRLGPTDDEVVRHLDERLAALSRDPDSGDYRCALVALAACLLDGFNDERLAALRGTERSPAVFGADDDVFVAVVAWCKDMGTSGDRVLARVPLPRYARRPCGWEYVAFARGADRRWLAAESAREALRVDDGSYSAASSPAAARALVQQRDALRRIRSLRALLRIAGEAAHVAPDLTPLLDDPDPRVALMAARVLRAIR